MRKVLIPGLVMLWSAVAIIGCKHSETPAPSQGTPTPGGGTPNPVNPNPNNPADTALCFERDILPIFISNCAKSGCHDAASRQDGFQFTDYNSIVSKEFVPGNANATELYEKITEDKNDKVMPPPPNPRLTATQISLIGRWINEGAKNTTNCGTNCDTVNVTFAGTIKPLTQQYCVGCHSTAAPSSGIALDSYTGVKTVALNGRLPGAIKHLAGYKPMPQGGNKLADCQVRQVEKWIAAGALDN